MWRGRFAPTPSGLLHLGNAAAALLAWLQIRSMNGEFVLRIEDIDGPRSKAEFARRIPGDLRWLGLDWEEGPDVGGPSGPYIQSQRLGYYGSVLDALDKLGRTYSCYCSRAELAAIASAPHGLASEGPAYPGICKKASKEELAEKAARKTPSVRFELPAEPLAFVDEAAGLQQVPAGAGGDFIVKRADGILAYQLAVVADDAAMGITHVLRGFDLLDSTPRQIWLYQALGWQAPQFAHVPLLLGPDGSRLSKRHGGITLADMRQRQIRPETVLGLIAHAYGLLDRFEPAAAKELIPLFSLQALPKEAVRLSEEDLAAVAYG
ncbi:tRNA glutamyl-Q(34) synthetase GluQRS [Paenibacillus sp. YN15]|uniref:tRNA glutamyl-Q(34) synthetase GluQRS n=1 Tax=Paenibacillus sp. YN15 TaxID=1742774 RepID=UPI000DCBA45A|nr:tRNA glutamyl-Q(34) synthetase GluQRS [Paenibacillus sp. YN15]RAV02430.1 tRNA glutamyl-Q(34) synthetase GluQRS [Paenibacillus sp. YN15]